MNTSDNSLDKIKEEVLFDMPHVAKAMKFPSLDITWRRLSLVDNGAHLLEQQLSINEFMRELVHEDITRTRTVYESRLHDSDPAAQEAVMALQSIQDYATRALSIIAIRQTAIRDALDQAHSLRDLPLPMDMPHTELHSARQPVW